jgi:hydroxyacylglutathione hydrolase
MLFFQISSGGDRNYGYLVGCENTKQAAVIDPSPSPLSCSEKARELGLTVKYVINTHTHYDHTGGNSFFQGKGAQLVTHQSAPVGDIRINDGDTLPLGDKTLSFIYTPGHTMDSICILAGKNLVTGDTLFVGKIGGTGTRDSAKIEFDSLQKLIKLDKEILVWPGHNYGVQPFSTIGEEIETNPFLQRLNSFDDFMWLKDNWAAYKVEHGIL